MTFRLVQRRMACRPTLVGWICLFGIACALLLWWWFECESFFCRTHRLPAKVLVVEGWIGRQGVQAAATEFKQGNYRYVVTTGGTTENRWNSDRWNYAEMAEHVLINEGVPKDEIIAAPTQAAKSQRTFASAVAAWQVLQARGFLPTTINLFTFGAHARRSRLIFAKVFHPGSAIGIISWMPSYEKAGPWWRSSDRAEDVIKETVGYTFEVLFSSGRHSNSPDQHLSLDPVQKP
jgi:hypothetical protein